MRGVVRWLLSADLPGGSKGVVSMIVGDVLASGGSFSLVPISHGPVLAWGWLPGIVAASVTSHPEVDEQGYRA